MTHMVVSIWLASAMFMLDWAGSIYDISYLYTYTKSMYVAATVSPSYNGSTNYLLSHSHCDSTLFSENECTSYSHLLVTHINHDGVAFIVHFIIII